MQVYGELDEREAFIAQERQLIANGRNYAEVEQLKKRYPAMAVATGIATAAVAAQLQSDFVREMMRDDRVIEPEPQAQPAPDAFDEAFDLSLDELEAASPAALSPQQSAAEADMALDFEAQLKQQADAQAAVDALSAVDLPADFDLSLADESVSPDAVPDSFSIELDKVNAELRRLSQDLEQPAMEMPFADVSREQDDEPEFDFLSGADEAATKLDLAQAYIDMGDSEGARDILNEVLTEGSEQQRGEAKEMLARLD